MDRFVLPGATDVGLIRFTSTGEQERYVAGHHRTHYADGFLRRRVSEFALLVNGLDRLVAQECVDDSEPLSSFKTES